MKRPVKRLMKRLMMEERGRVKEDGWEMLQVHCLLLS
jgi:histone H3/H4